MVNVGIIGLGGIGRVHYNCHLASRNGRIVAMCDIDEHKRTGDWASIELNIDPSKTPHVDLAGIAMYENYHDLLADPRIDLVDICLPTYLHAEVAMAALAAGKNVMCEKPMVRHESEIEPLLAIWRKSGKRLLIGHCLRYWGHYVKTAEIIQSGQYGKPLSATMTRAGGTPTGSNGWFRNGDLSGGVVLDMHIHDVDAALWWFGKPDKIEASGRFCDGMPALVNTTWTYDGGHLVQLYSEWDNNQTPFRYSFSVVLERATLVHDSAIGPQLKLYRAGEEPTDLEVDGAFPYQLEIQDLLDSVANGTPLERVTPEASGLAVKTALEEIRLIEARHPVATV